MIYIPEVKARIEALTPRWHKGRLAQQELLEFNSLINEVVREARRSRSCHVSFNARPEEYLLGLFKQRNQFAVNKFLRRLNLPEGEKSEWNDYANRFIRTIILGDYSDRQDHKAEVKRYLEEFISSEDKLLDLNRLSVKAKRDALLGQSGPHKKKGYLDELRKPENIEKNEKLLRAGKPSDIFKEVDTSEGGFLIKDRAAIEVSKTIALKYKPFGKKNPHIKEPTGYDPDYMPLELRELLGQKLEKWAMDASVDDVFDTEGYEKILSGLKKQPTYREPSLINYIFGSKEKPGRLHWRLVDVLKRKRKRRQREIMETNLRYPGDERNSLLDKSAANTSDENSTRIIESLDREKLCETIEPILTKIQFEICIMHFTNNLKPSEIAEQLGTTRQNVYKHLHKIKQRLSVNSDKFKPFL